MRTGPSALMLFAAGFGTRMGVLTADRPKPLIAVAGVPLIDRALALVEAAGIGRIVVNTHYLGDRIAAHLAGRPGITLSPEAPDILDTGGGLRAALPLLGPGPVFTLNPDGVFTGANPLAELAAAWDPARMEALLLLGPIVAQGDFACGPDGRLARSAGGPGHRYLGAQILDPEGLHDIQEIAFSLNRLWDAMIARGTLFGLAHAGGWCDVGTPEGIAAAEALLGGTDG
ncbi:MAG TPA: nucleotidyltransferase family protein [Paracoccaceae bacterium]|nr:nucleotidyltransferase family protein [Paracoccaceae bacterium]HMO70972.1 nucleotidyltransferase family protein [Paracoccaceae bacterium]